MSELSFPLSPNGERGHRAERGGGEGAVRRAAFDPAETLPLGAPALRAKLAQCTLCAEEAFYAKGPPLHKGGRLPAPIFVLGQAPAAVHADDPTTRPFSPGRHGQGSPLWRWFAQAGWEEEAFRRAAYISAITRCYPGPAPSGSGDRRPTAREQALCRPHWTRELALARPEIIIPLGTMALAALGFRGARLQDAVGSVYFLDTPRRSIPVVALPHPSGVSRWLNDAANRAHHERALEQIARLTEPIRNGMENGA